MRVWKTPNNGFSRSLYFTFVCHAGSPAFQSLTKLDLMCRSRVVSYIHRVNPKIEKDKIFRCTKLGADQYEVQMDLPISGTSVKAVGMAESDKDAEVACSMHAESILDTLGIPVFTLSSSQKKHAEQKKKEGKYAPMPGDPIKPVESTVLPPPLEYIGLDKASRNKLQTSKVTYVATAEDAELEAIESMDGKYMLCSLPLESQSTTGLYIANPRIYDSLSVDRMNRLFYVFFKIHVEKVVQINEVWMPTGLSRTQMKYFEAIIDIPLDVKTFGARQAIGVGKTPKLALSCAMMHMELIFDALGIPVFRTNEQQQAHASGVRKCGRWAPMPGDGVRPKVPSPLPLKRTELKLLVEPSKAQEKDVFDDVPFVEVEIIDSSAVKTLKIYHSKLRLPFFNEKVSISTVHQGYMFRSMKTVRATYNIPLDVERFGKRVAIGVAHSQVKAEILCCMHAVQILKALHADKGFIGASPQIPSPPALCFTSDFQTDIDVDAPFLENKNQNMEQEKTEGEEAINEQVEGERVDAPPPTRWYAGTADGYILLHLLTRTMSEHTLLKYREFDVSSKSRMIRFLKEHRMRMSEAFASSKIVLTDPQNPGKFRVTYWRCIGTFNLPGIGTVTSIGEAQSNQDALIASCMHAELLIDHLGFQMYKLPAMQTKHASMARKTGRYAPYPGDPVRPEELGTIPPPLRRKMGSMKTAQFSKYVASNSSSEVYEDVSLNAYNAVDVNALSLYCSRLSEKKRVQLFDRMEVTTQEIDNTKYHRATLRVPVPEEYGERLAVGVATNVNDSQRVCAMHAIRIIDTLGICLHSTGAEQLLHRKQVLSEGRFAPLPQQPMAPPTTLSPSPLKLRESKAKSFPSPPTNVNDVEAWYSYAEEVEETLEVVREQREMEYFKQGKIPRIGDRIFDFALDEIENDKMSFVGMSSILMSWCDRSGNLFPKNMKSRSIEGLGVLTSFPVPGYPHYTAYGFAKKRDTSIKRAMTHCVYMLKTLDSDFSDADRRGKIRISANNWDQSVGGLTSEGQYNLLKLYCLVSGADPVSTVTKYMKDNGNYEVTMTVRDPNGQQFQAVKIHGTRAGAADAARQEIIKMMIESNDQMSVDIPNLVGLLQKHSTTFDLRAIPNLSTLFRVDKELNDRLTEIVGVFSDVEDLEVEASRLTRAKLLESLTTPHAAPEFDPSIADKLKRKLSHPQYIHRFAKQREALPISSLRNDILTSLHTNQVIIVCSAAGSGKTTQIPQYILDDCTERQMPCYIGVTQPRRISAISVSKRVAEERLERTGDVVGYSVRLDSQYGSHINFMTGGILLRRMQSDRYFSEFTHIILDEVHERDMNTDMLLMLVRDILPRQPNLKVIIMSATMHSTTFSEYFNNAPVLHCDKGMHEVTVQYLEDIAVIAKQRNVVTTSLLNIAPAAELLNNIGNGNNASNGLVKALTAVDYRLLTFLLDHILQTNPDVMEKCILVFLPGWSEILMASEASAHLQSKALIITMHSSVPQEVQMLAFSPAPEGKVKICFSTNICESAITIPDVVVVIDCGRLKEMISVSHHGGADVSTRHSQLVQMHASKANCIQRAGRAGRTQRGICYRMFSKEHYELLPSYQTPEITRVPLDGICLMLLTFGVKNPMDFLLNNALDRPREDIIQSAMRMLQDAGAVDGDMNLTPLGYQMAPLPVDPSTAKMVLLGLALGCLDVALTIAAASQIDPFETSYDFRDVVKLNRDILARKSRSDVISYVNAYNQWINCVRDGSESEEKFLADHSLVRNKLQQMSRVKHQIYKILLDIGYVTDDGSVECDRDAFIDLSTHSTLSTNVVLVKGLLACAYYPNVAYKSGRSYRIKNGEALVDSSTIAVPLEFIEDTRQQQNIAPFIVYGNCIKQGTTSVSHVTLRLSEITNLTAWPLVLLGAATVNMVAVEDTNLVLLDGWIFVMADAETFQLIRKLKLGMSLALTQRLQNAQDKGSRQMLRRIQRAYVMLLQSADQHSEFQEKGHIIAYGEQYAKLK